MTQETGDGTQGVQAAPDPAPEAPPAEPAGGGTPPGGDAGSGPLADLPGLPTVDDVGRFSDNLRAHHTHAWASRVLASEEPVLAWCLADYNGTVPPDHARVDAAIAEVTPEGEAPPLAPPEPETLVAFPTASRLALVLTPQRILVFGVGLRGTPKKFLGSVPLPAVRELRSRKGQYGDQLTVVMRSGAVVDLERRDGDSPGTFVARLAEHRPGPDAVAGAG